MLQHYALMLNYSAQTLPAALEFNFNVSTVWSTNTVQLFNAQPHPAILLPAVLWFNSYSCIDIYSYSCLHPLSNEQKSMFKSGDSRAVWTWVRTWKYLRWALHYLHDVIYGKYCGPDWSFRRCFCSRKRCVRLWRPKVHSRRHFV